MRRSLKTTDRALAKRDELARINLAAGKCSLTEMCDRYLTTIQDQKPRTVRRKRDIDAR